LLPDAARLAHHLASVSWINFLAGHVEVAVEEALEALDLAATVGDEYLLGMCETSVGNALTRVATPAECRVHHERALRHFEAAGDDRGCAASLLNLASDELDRGEDRDLPVAIRYAERAKTTGGNLKNPSVVAFTQGAIGPTYLLLDDHEQAWHYIRDALDRAYRLGITRLIASCLLHLALIGCADAPVAAAEFVGHADALLARVGAVYEEAFRMI